MKLKNKSFLLWLFGLDDNIMNSLNLIGLAITTYGVMYFLPKNNVRFALGIACLGFIILAFFKILVYILNPKKRRYK